MYQNVKPKLNWPLKSVLRVNVNVKFSGNWIEYDGTPKVFNWEPEVTVTRRKLLRSCANNIPLIEVQFSEQTNLFAGERLNEATEMLCGRLFLSANTIIVNLIFIIHL